jgi:hypothetical protein
MRKMNKNQKKQTNKKQEGRTEISRASSVFQRRLGHLAVKYTCKRAHGLIPDTAVTAVAQHGNAHS